MVGGRRFVRCWLFDVGCCWLVVVCLSLVVVGWRSFVVSCLLLVVCGVVVLCLVFGILVFEVCRLSVVDW